MAGTRVWESPPGEWHQAMTGEHGGLWRHRGRPPQALAGVGFTAQGFDRSLPYRVEAAAAGGRAGFILAGIDLAAPLGGAGSVLGGPAGFEIDRADPALGTPANTVLVASAREFSDVYSPYENLGIIRFGILKQEEKPRLAQAVHSSSRDSGPLPRPCRFNHPCNAR